jgi:flagellar biosynthesis protein FlhG
MQPQSIAITSGKGGVGKTYLSINLAVAIQRLNQRVLLFDSDLALANAHIFLGSQVQHTILDALSDHMSMRDVLTDGPDGMKLIAGGSGLSELLGLSPDLRRHIVSMFSDLAPYFDYLIVDTAAGIEENVLDFVEAADRIIVVVVGEPAAFVDAYASIKILSQESGREEFDVVVNMARDEAHGREIFNRFRSISSEFLDVKLNHLGTVPHDEYLLQAVSRCEPIVKCFPDAPAARAIERIASAIMTSHPPEPIGVHRGFF